MIKYPWDDTQKVEPVPKLRDMELDFIPTPGDDGRPSRRFKMVPSLSFRKSDDDDDDDDDDLLLLLLFLFLRKLVIVEKGNDDDDDDDDGGGGGITAYDVTELTLGLHFLTTFITDDSLLPPFKLLLLLVMVL